MPSILPPGPWQQNGRWIVRRLWVLTRRPPHIPAIALFHHHLPSVPQLWGLLKVHYWLKATALQNVWREIGVPSAALSLLMSCVWERQVVAGAALCIPRGAECPPCPATALPWTSTWTPSSLLQWWITSRVFHKLGLLSCVTGKYSSDSPTAAKTICHF